MPGKGTSDPVVGNSIPPGAPLLPLKHQGEIIKVSVAYTDLPGPFGRVIPPPKLHRFLVSPAVLLQQEAGSMGWLDGAML
jgi:hypothetical protein